MNFLRDIKKNLSIIHSLNHIYLPLLMLCTILNTIVPLINITLGANILDQLEQKEPVSSIMIQVGILVGSTFVFSLISQTVTRYNNRNVRQILSKRNLLLSAKAMQLDFDLFERKETNDLIAKADEGIEAYGGLGNYSRSVFSLVGNFLSIISALISITGLFIVASVDGGGK